MLAVVPAVRQLLPGLLRDPRPSVACVYTTRPKYLIFDGSSEQPACVVEFGETERLAAVEKVLAALSPRLPQTVPATLRCAHWEAGTSVHVQQGLPGTPWFRLSDEVKTRDAWVALLTRASQVLASFHAAVREVPEWSALVYPGMELQRQAMLSRFRGVALSERVLQRIEEWSTEADRGGALPGCCQHGDFSLNNLLVSPTSIAIIDFDEFGRTRVPLHDVFGLALSVRLSQGDGCDLTTRECIMQCVAASSADEDVPRAAMPALLLHHLLWRVNQCDGLERRQPLRNKLLRWAEELAAKPDTFLGELA
jgi:Phosphotransferase enzyme family